MKETDAVVMTVCRRRFGQAKSSVLAAVYASHDQAIQALVSAIDGCYFNVVGMSVAAVVDGARRLGVTLV